MKQQTPHRRAQVLRAALAAVEERRDTRVPTDLPGVAATVGDELALLGALTLRWHTRLAGLVEREQQRTPRDPAGATERAWARAADEMPGLRALLDHHRAHPRDDRTAEATVRATATEHALLAVAAGRAEVGDPRAAGAGAAVEQAARARRLAGLTTLAARAADDGVAVALASYRPRRAAAGPAPVARGGLSRRLSTCPSRPSPRAAGGAPAPGCCWWPPPPCSTPTSPTPWCCCSTSTTTARSGSCSTGPPRCRSREVLPAWGDGRRRARGALPGRTGGTDGALAVALVGGRRTTRPAGSASARSPRRWAWSTSTPPSSWSPRAGGPAGLRRVRRVGRGPARRARSPRAAGTSSPASRRRLPRRPRRPVARGAAPPARRAGLALHPSRRPRPELIADLT